MVVRHSVGFHTTYLVLKMGSFQILAAKSRFNIFSFSAKLLHLRWVRKAKSERPNNQKPEGQKLKTRWLNQKAEFDRTPEFDHKAKFDRKAENSTSMVPTCYIKD